MIWLFDFRALTSRFSHHDIAQYGNERLCSAEKAKLWHEELQPDIGTEKKKQWFKMELGVCNNADGYLHLKN